MEHFFRNTFTLDRSVRIALALLSLSLLWLGLSAVWEVLLPFLLAGLFAYVMMPLVRILQKKLWVRNRGLAVLIVFVLFGGLVVTGLLYLIPEIEAEVSKTIEILRLHSGDKALLDLILPDQAKAFISKNFNFDQLSKALSPNLIADTTQTIWNQVSGIISGTLSVFSWSLVFAMGLIYFIFIMIDFEGLVHGSLRLVPEGWRATVHGVLKEIDYYMNSYFRGQALIALSVGILCTIGFNIIDLPMATALGVIIGLLNFVPYMQALGVPPLALMAILQAAQTGQNVALCLVLAFGVLVLVQILQETILVPRIMGSSMGMRPSLILLSLSIWGYLLGFFGMLIALPATMALYSIYMRFVLRDEAYIEAIDRKMKARQGSNKPSDTQEQQTSAQ